MYALKINHSCMKLYQSHCFSQWLVVRIGLKCWHFWRTPRFLKKFPSPNPWNKFRKFLLMDFPETTCEVHERKGLPWLFRGFVGDEILPSYIGFIIKPLQGSLLTNQYFMQSKRISSMAQVDFYFFLKLLSLKN